MTFKLDPHIHSCYSSDCLTKIEDIIKKSTRLGLNIIGISDHNTIEGSKKAIDLTKNNEDLLVIPSIEISTIDGHMLGFGVEEEIPKGLTPEETIEKIHEANGLAIVPHPYCFYRHGLLSKLGHAKIDIDAIEEKNARFLIGYSNNKAKKLTKKLKLPGLGSSDAHYVDFIGDCYSEIDCQMNIDSVLKAIKKGKVKAKGNGTSNILLAKYLINKNFKKNTR